MSKQSCKVFIGGLSWDTNDTRLRTYFENFGAVKEAFVSYDRETGKPRGFGFVVFEDATVADRVVQNKHTIDRREVDAKHAMPRQDASLQPTSQTAQDDMTMAPSSRKIFVGGLPSSVVDASLRQYFERYGPVEDAVVMIDHHSKRSRGFGFVTFRDDKSLDNVLQFDSRPVVHGKEVEVKRAVPRDQLQQEPQRGRMRAYGRGFDPRMMPYPYGFYPPGPVPYAYGMPDMPAMDRHPRSPYYGRSEQDIAQPMMYGGMQLRPVDMHRGMGDAQWPAHSEIAGIGDPLGDSNGAWADADQHAHMGSQAHTQAMQNVGNLPMFGMHDSSDGQDRHGHGLDNKSQPVSFANSKHGPGQQGTSNQEGAPDAFENLASSLGATLPLIGGQSYLHK